MLKRGVSLFVAIILLTLSCSYLIGCGRIKEDTFKEIKDNIYNSTRLNINFDDQNIKTELILNTINSNGSFNDIDYSSTAQSNWKPFNHLTRIKDLTLSYVYNESKYYNNAEVFESINKGLNYWYDVNPKSTNWFYAEISNPNAIGLTLILSEFGKNKLQSGLIEDLLKRMKKDGGNPSKWTGANKCDIALNWLYRGVLTKSSFILKKAIKQAYSVLKITNNEGIQADFSYQQHGAQLYNLGYGNSLMSSITAIALATTNTELELKTKELKALSGFIINGYISGMRGKYGSFNLNGRGLARKDTIDNSQSVDLLQKMSIIDKENQDIYYDAIKRITEDDISYKLKEKNNYFYRSDYALHNDTNYNFDVRTVSNRTVRTEQGNGENKNGYFLSDGAYGINLTGEEYFNIFPLWNWTMVPGVTAPQLDEIPVAKLWEHKGVSNFVGGVSDGKEGVSTYFYYDTYNGINTGAKKSWFMLDNHIICLGSDIRSENSAEIFTSINQTYKRGDVLYIDSNGVLATANNDYNILKGVKSVFHNNIVYTPLNNTVLYIKNQERIGNWKDINENSDDLTERDNIFSIYYNHGIMPKGESYQYAITPAIKKEDYKNVNLDNIRILYNDEKIQAIKKEETVFAIFYEKGMLVDSNLTISVDKPCIIMIKGDKVFISDPSQKFFDIRIKIEKNNNAKDYVVHFNRNKECLGKTEILTL